jgi:hypothetical protein
MIAYPFRLLQCCLVTDRGSALILVWAERARDFPQSLPVAVNRGPVYLLGIGESGETPMVSQMQDLTSSRAFHVAGRKAFAEAGVTRDDVDHLMIYDTPCSLPGASFAHLPIYGLGPPTARSDRHEPPYRESWPIVARSSPRRRSKDPRRRFPASRRGATTAAHGGMAGREAASRSPRHRRGVQGMIPHLFTKF